MVGKAEGVAGLSVEGDGEGIVEAESVAEGGGVVEGMTGLSEPWV